MLMEIKGARHRGCQRKPRELGEGSYLTVIWKMAVKTVCILVDVLA